MSVSGSDNGKVYSWSDVSGNVYYYYKHPMTKAVLFVLLQELCERLAFYGLMPNLQIFLKEYLGVDDAGANSYISTFNAILYVTPLLSAVISDTILGLYLTILAFSFVYMAGLALLTLSTIHSISQPWMIHVSLLFLIAFGAGGIKSCVNVMGAQQFHPEEHKDLITRYYTYFYASINLGSIVGGIVTPILVESVSFTASFSFPLVAFIIATIVFVVGNVMGRYVKPKPQGSAVLEILKVIFFSLTRCSLEKNKESNGGRFKDGFIEDAKALFRLVPLFSLIIPFVMAYNNMTTAFLTQGKKMDTSLFGWDMPAQMMQNVDPIAVVLTSVLVDTVLFPLLKKYNMMPSVLVRFCIGSLCGAASLLVALGVEYMVMSKAVFSVSIWWQIPQFWLIAAGEIFLISTSYEVAFTYSPGALKAVASAFNLCFFSISNVLSAVLFQVCSEWLPNFDIKNPTEEAVSGAHYDYYYMVLVALCIFGAVGAVSMIPYFNRVAAKNAARKAEAELENVVKKDEVDV
ncbi:Tripeptide permease tppB, putative [Perkinsus marinus ATCC 50983]|uniref:Tripeptide permease tppB, putative n=2 Tax=Perkinsus marinus (strain ATCC 50983 / TXsc) TaxID=423536 RepID=C5KWB0_PERM5|nr:Tripeptide permease tppB, putative [Perkinsus marinus ATCC 50983]EER11221.1 Tripeptide permease tppB, putative [Perkinsus marinus ATCC 50983]|eukprot:XP_002779426.1 Tripeptide permease tppB, putative [Perkinsus marinus ATCC 50983]